MFTVKWDLLLNGNPRSALTGFEFVNTTSRKIGAVIDAEMNKITIIIIVPTTDETP